MGFEKFVHRGQAAQRELDELLDQAEVKDFLFRFEREGLPKIRDSHVVTCIVSDDPGAKQCLEMGAALLLDKPIILAVLKGRKVPKGLRKVGRCHRGNRGLWFTRSDGETYSRHRRNPKEKEQVRTDAAREN